MAHGGPTGVLIFVNTVADMTTLDAVYAAMNTNETYWSMVNAATDTGLFDTASSTDNILSKLT